MDYSKLSDQALEMITSGKVDYSKLSDDDLSVISQAPAPKPSKLESAIRGAAQGLSLGFEDEARAAIMAPFSKKDYGQIRDEIREKNKAAQNENPLTYGGAELTSGIATTFVPGLNIAKAASVGNAAAKAALIGGLSGLGGAEGDIVDQATQTAVGAGLGGALGAAGAKLSKSFKKGAEKAAEMSTGATGREQQIKFKPGSGRKLLDSGFVGWFDSPESIAKKSKTALKETSKDIGKSLKVLDMTDAGVSKDQLLANLFSERAILSKRDANASAVKKLDEAIETIAKKSDNKFSFSELWDQKIGHDKNVNWKAKITDPDKAQASAIVSKAYVNAVDDVASKIAPELAEKFEQERKLFSLLKPVNEASERRASMLQQQQIGGLLDLGSGAIGAGIGTARGDNPMEALAKGFAAASARRVVGPRAASTLAKTLDSALLNNTVKKLPAVLSGQNADKITELLNMTRKK